MKKTILLLFTFLFLLPRINFSDEKPTIVVYDLIVKGNAITNEQADVLSNRVRSTISKTGKYLLVSPKEIQKFVGEYLRQKEFSEDAMCDEDSCMVEVAGALGAEKVISGTIAKIGNTYTLDINMKDMLTKRISKSATKDCKNCEIDDLIKVVENAAKQVAEGKRTSTFKEGTIGEEAEDWEIQDDTEEVIVKFESEPTGAVVLADGNLVCPKTPCSKSITSGSHEISMQAEKYLKRSETVSLKNGLELNWKLKPNFGWLTVTSEPSGQDVAINGKLSGTTPIRRKEFSPGGYEVLITSNCHYDSGKRVRIERDEEETIDVVLKEKQGGIKVKARDKDGNDLIADVYVDREYLGTTTKTYKISICSKNLEIKHKKHGSFKKDLSVKEKKIVRITAELKNGRSSSGVIVTDSDTGLMWQKQRADKTMKWREAKNYCKNLELSGYSDWELPKKKDYIELLGGCDQKVLNGKYGYCNKCSKSNKCSKMFPGDTKYYWTSDEYSSSNAWNVNFGSGYVYYNNKDSILYVRCVQRSRQ